MSLFRLQRIKAIEIVFIAYLTILFLFGSKGYSQGFPEITGTPGDLVWESRSIGGRVATYHRGYYLAHSKLLGPTHVLDFSPLEFGNEPEIVATFPGGSNGHAWSKIGDVYARGYTMPEFDDVGWVDLSDMTNIVEYTGPLQWDDSRLVFVNTHPISYFHWSDQLQDNRTFELYDDTPELRGGLGLGGEIIIGNLLFCLPLGPVDGIAIWDVGDPAHPRLLSMLNDRISNYPDGWSVYKNHIIITSGDDTNEGNNNMLAIDFSDPNNAHISKSFSVNEIGPARYSVFQDNYGFVANGNTWRKIDMENETVETFITPGDATLGDFWPMAIGNLVIFNEGQDFGDQIAMFVHDEELDTNGPEIGYHVPEDGAVGYSRLAGLGLVINECLAGETVTTDNIILTRCTDGAAVAGTIIHNSYATLQWVPDEPLEENMSYTLSVTSGLTDCVGNGAEPYSFTFSTGGTLACGGVVPVNNPPIIESFTSSASRVATGETVIFEAEVSDADGDALEYRWDFDDGNTTDWTNNNTESHRYATPGNYQVVVQVRDGEASTQFYSNISVSESTAAAQVVHSSPILLDEINRQVWVVNPDNNSFTSISVDDLTVQNEYAVGADPTSIAMGIDGNLWITCRDADEVWVLNPDDGGVVTIIDMGRGSRPFAVIPDPNDNFMYVSEMGSGEVSRISTNDRRVEQSIYVGPTPRAMTVDANSTTLYVTRMISGSEGGTIYRVDLSDFSVATAIQLAIDETSPPSSGVNGPGIPNYVSAVAINPNGNELVYTSKKDNIFNGTSTVRNGFEFTFERTVRSIIGKVSLETNQEQVDERVDIDDMAQPSSVTYSENGNYVIVTMQGNNLVIVLDAFTGSELAREATGLAPQGAVIDTQTDRIFTKDFMERTVTVFDASSVFDGSAGEMEMLAQLTTVFEEQLTNEVLRGKQIFYNSDDTRMTQQGDNDNGYITCATCHIDGTHDGIVWDFTQRGEGLRNTTSLRGRAGTGHGRIHWTANFDETQDFEHDIRNAFGGQGFMTDDDFNTGTRNTTLGDAKRGISTELDALAAYLESLDSFDPSPYKPGDDTFTADALLGREIFERLECASCHSGADFTNSSTGLLADVGTVTTTSGSRLANTIFGLDVPTLKDVWSTAPYLHDGSAQTLYDVFDSHVGTEDLTETELGQLVAYLEQIDDTETSRGESFSLSIAAPTVDEELAIGSAIPFEVNSSIGNEEIVRIDYYANGMEVATVSQAPFATSWTPTEVGSYDLQAKVFLSNGMELVTSDRIHYVTTVVVEEPVLGTSPEELGIQVYPNPFTDELSIRIEENEASMEVLDLGGKTLLRKKLGNGRNYLNLESLNAGVYMLRVTNSAGTKVMRVVRQ